MESLVSGLHFDFPPDSEVRRVEHRIVGVYHLAGIAIFDAIAGFDLAGTQGFVIAPRARLRVFHHDAPTVENVSSFIHDNHDVLALAPYVLGMWGEADKHLLDVCFYLLKLLVLLSADLRQLLVSLFQELFVFLCVSAQFFIVAFQRDVFCGFLGE